MTTPEPSTTYLLSLGSNLGDRAATIAAAVAALGELPGATVRASEPIETVPMYVTDQPPFLNAAAVVECALKPTEMLESILRIERQHGRERGIRFGPRTLDIDIIAAGDVVVDTPTLVLPHPRMHERGFVLRPLVSLAPDWVHPVLGRRLAELLADLDATSEVA